jgi:hypothetical protein
MFLTAPEGRILQATFFQISEAPWWEKVTPSLHPPHDGCTMWGSGGCKAPRSKRLLIFGSGTWGKVI